MLLFLTGLFPAVLAAVVCSRLSCAKQNLILNLLAVLLPLSELWKQLFLTASCGGNYQWWYLPFQLCSMPLYLLPLRQLFRPSSFCSSVLTVFLADFGLLAGIFAFADQTGMHYAQPALTLHSYLWHFILIFLGLFLHFSGQVQRARSGFLPAAFLFLMLALAAELLNLLFRTRGSLDMFYISPWEPSTQVIFRDIAAYVGRGPEILIYLGIILCGAALIHRLFKRLSERKSAS